LKVPILFSRHEHRILTGQKPYFLNSLTGGLGNDTLAGNTGNDTLTGGAGIDQIEYRSTRVLVASDFGVDTITDFVLNQDKIVLSKTTFAALTSEVGNGFSQASNFALVANNSLVDAIAVCSRMRYNATSYKSV